MSPEERRLKQREWSRVWRERHPEQRLASAKAANQKRRAAHPDENRERCKAYRDGHRDELEERRRARWAADAEYRTQSNARRLQRHHEHRGEANEKRASNALAARVHSPWRHLLRAAAERAAKKGLPFTLTEEWAAARWTGRCEVTDIEFFLKGRGPGPKFFSPSVDQITAKGGYTAENCRFVLWAVNSFKHDATDADMILVAHAIARKYPLVSAS